MNTAKKSIWADTLAVLISVVVSLLFFIVVDIAFSSSILSSLQSEPLSSEKKPYQEMDKGWYELKSDFTGFDNWGDKIYPVKTDHFGFRMDDQQTMPSAKADVIFLGDSFTYGINGGWSETFVGMLEKHIGRRVINAGVSSYSPTVYLYQYQKALDAKILTQGHTVVVALDISDIQDEATRWEAGSAHPVLLQPLQAKPSGEMRLSDKIKARLQFTRSIYGFLKNLVGAPSANSAFDSARAAFTWQDWKALDNEPYPYGYAPHGVAGGIERTSIQLKKIGKLANQQNAKFYILIYPWPTQIKYGTSRIKWEEYVTDLCKELRCAGVINVFPAFREIAAHEASWYGKYFVEGDVHFNKQGNTVVFDEIAKRIH
jgi:hypothetical protein